MAHYTIRVGFLAPIPVRHRVAVEVYVRNRGILSTKIEVDQNAPTLVDLETGIRWQGEIVQIPDPHRALHQTYYGRVVGCEVISGGGDNTTIRTHLTVDPMEPPGASADPR